MRLDVAILAALTLSFSQIPGYAQTAKSEYTPVLGQRQKQAKDPAERKAYIDALREADLDVQALEFEKFLQQYPDSVVKEDVLEQMMGAYVALGDTSKATDAATRVLQVDADNPRALAVLAYAKRAAIESGQSAEQNAAQAKEYGMRGLRAVRASLKPEGMSDADFEALKWQMTIIFDGAIGLAALKTKDYSTAQEHLQSAVELHDLSSSSNDATLRDVYPLALAYLEAKPMDPAGLWYIARAASLSNFDPKLVAYGRLQYAKYHGSENGWDDLVRKAEYSTALLVDVAAPSSRENPAYPKDFTALVESKDWTPFSLEIRNSAVVNQLGSVSANAIIAGRPAVLLCTYACPTLQAGTYRAEVKDGEIHVYSVSSKNEKPRTSTFRLNDSW